MERVERRGSIARAFGRIRMAMKRRRPIDTQDVQNGKHVNGFANGHSLLAHSTNDHIPVERPTTITSTSGNFSYISPKTVMDQRLEADADDDNDLEEALLPIAHNRPGVSDSKARDLYSRYGLLYAQENMSLEERPVKLRRVERPIRMRVHWICHACKKQFGIAKTCVECGHAKCAQCPRQPPKRVKEVMENGRLMMRQSELSQREIISTGNESGKSNSSPVHSAMPSPSLERSSSFDADGDVGHPSFDYTLSPQPAAAVHMFEPDYQHIRCKRLLAMDKWTQGSTTLHKMTNGEMPIMKAAVRRVYRKPRQRVRYTCEHCSTLLVEGDRCRECDRDRFLRSPPRRTSTQYEADIFQSVANRLAARGEGFGLPQGLTA